MRTNEDVSIKTDWALNGIVKPAHMNALTSAVQYDYVVTEQMLSGKTGTVNVDTLLGGNKINGTTGEYHVLINAVVPSVVTLLFPADSVGGGSGSLIIHVHTIGPFKASMGQGGIPNISYYFHTHGSAEAVTLLDASHTMHVGAFNMASAVELGGGYEFTYEEALGQVPVPAEGVTCTITRAAWMSNSLSEPPAPVQVPPSSIIRLSYPDKNGVEVLYASSSEGPLDPSIGLSAAKALPLKDTVQVNWVTWHSRGKVDSGSGTAAAHNSNKTLYLDTSHMIEGVVYEIAVKCYCEKAKAGDAIIGGVSYDTVAAKYGVTASQYGVHSELEGAMGASALPIVENKATCTIEVATSNGTTTITVSAPVGKTYSGVWGGSDPSVNIPDGTYSDCEILSTPGRMEILLGVLGRSLLLESNVGVDAGLVSRVTYTPEKLVGFAIASASGNDLWTPSATSGVSTLFLTLAEITDAFPEAESSNEATVPNFVGSVYLLKASNKVMILGY